MAVATDDSVDEETKNDSKILSESLLSDSPPADTQHSAKPNLYEPEPRAPAKVKVIRERNQKNVETREPVDHPYCAMDGTDTSEYLQPVMVCSDGGYLMMGSPPNYDSCVDQDPPVSYANTENEDPTIDMEREPDCGMMGYDVPPPMHLYSEIPGNEDEVDNEGNHIYESLDQVKEQ